MGERPPGAPGPGYEDQGSSRPRGARTESGRGSLDPRRRGGSRDVARLPLSGEELTIVPVDPLADEYDRLLRDAKLDPPIRTVRVAGEALAEHFGARRFDIAYATNSLDHSADPFTIISNMAAVVRPGGVVLLRHKRNEGDSARYGGMHQWNFDVVDDGLLVWNNAVRGERRRRARGTRRDDGMDLGGRGDRASRCGRGRLATESQVSLSGAVGLALRFQTGASQLPRPPVPHRWYELPRSPSSRATRAGRPSPSH